MDEVKRIHARQKIASAKELEKRYCIKEAITEYLRAIDLFLQISNKTPEDINAIVNVHYDLATLYFNRRDYLSAGRHYEAAINQLIETPLKDDSYRLLTELYIDLSDACYELMNQSAGDEAMANALKAFGLIQNKTFEEQQIGDPVANFKQFHIFYEKKLSTKSYLNSAKFMNHEYLLGEGQGSRSKRFLSSLKIYRLVKYNKLIVAWKICYRNCLWQQNPQTLIQSLELIELFLTRFL